MCKVMEEKSILTTLERDVTHNFKERYLKSLNIEPPVSMATKPRISSTSSLRDSRPSQSSVDSGICLPSSPSVSSWDDGDGVVGAGGAECGESTSSFRDGVGGCTSLPGNRDTIGRYENTRDNHSGIHQGNQRIINDSYGGKIIGRNYGQSSIIAYSSPPPSSSSSSMTETSLSASLSSSWLSSVVLSPESSISTTTSSPPSISSSSSIVKTSPSPTIKKFSTKVSPFRQDNSSSISSIDREKIKEEYIQSLGLAKRSSKVSKLFPDLNRRLSQFKQSEARHGPITPPQFVTSYSKSKAMEEKETTEKQPNTKVSPKLSNKRTTSIPKFSKSCSISGSDFDNEETSEGTSERETLYCFNDSYVTKSNSGKSRDSNVTENFTSHSTSVQDGSGLAIRQCKNAVHSKPDDRSLFEHSIGHSQPGVISKCVADRLVYHDQSDQVNTKRMKTETRDLSCSTVLNKQETIPLSQSLPLNRPRSGSLDDPPLCSPPCPEILGELSRLSCNLNTVDNNVPKKRPRPVLRRMQSCDQFSMDSREICQPEPSNRHLNTIVSDERETSELSGYMPANIATRKKKLFLRTQSLDDDIETGVMVDDSCQTINKPVKDFDSRPTVGSLKSKLQHFDPRHNTTTVDKDKNKKPSKIPLAMNRDKILSMVSRFETFKDTATPSKTFRKEDAGKREEEIMQLRERKTVKKVSKRITTRLTRVSTESENLNIPSAKDVIVGEKRRTSSVSTCSVENVFKLDSSDCQNDECRDDNIESGVVIVPEETSIAGNIKENAIEVRTKGAFICNRLSLYEGVDDEKEDNWMEIHERKKDKNKRFQVDELNNDDDAADGKVGSRGKLLLQSELPTCAVFDDGDDDNDDDIMMINTNKDADVMNEGWKKREEENVKPVVEVKTRGKEEVEKAEKLTVDDKNDDDWNDCEANDFSNMAMITFPTVPNYGLAGVCNPALPGRPGSCVLFSPDKADDLLFHEQNDDNKRRINNNEEYHDLFSIMKSDSVASWSDRRMGENGTRCEKPHGERELGDAENGSKNDEWINEGNIYQQEDNGVLLPDVELMMNHNRGVSYTNNNLVPSSCLIDDDGDGDYDDDDNNNNNGDTYGDNDDDDDDNNNNGDAYGNHRTENINLGHRSTGVNRDGFSTEGNDFCAWDSTKLDGKERSGGDVNENNSKGEIFVELEKNGDDGQDGLLIPTTEIDKTACSLHDEKLTDKHPCGDFRASICYCLETEGHNNDVSEAIPTRHPLSTKDHTDGLQRELISRSCKDPQTDLFDLGNDDVETDLGSTRVDYQNSGLETSLDQRLGGGKGDENRCGHSTVEITPPEISTTVHCDTLPDPPSRHVLVPASATAVCSNNTVVSDGGVGLSESVIGRDTACSSDDGQTAPFINVTLFGLHINDGQGGAKVNSVPVGRCFFSEEDDCCPCLDNSDSDKCNVDVKLDDGDDDDDDDDDNDDPISHGDVDFGQCTQRNTNYINENTERCTVECGVGLSEKRELCVICEENCVSRLINERDLNTRNDERSLLRVRPNDSRIKGNGTASCDESVSCCESCGDSLFSNTFRKDPRVDVDTSDSFKCLDSSRYEEDCYQYVRRNESVINLNSERNGNILSDAVVEISANRTNFIDSYGVAGTDEHCEKSVFPVEKDSASEICASLDFDRNCVSSRNEERYRITQETTSAINDYYDEKSTSVVSKVPDTPERIIAGTHSSKDDLSLIGGNSDNTVSEEINRWDSCSVEFGYVENILLDSRVIEKKYGGCDGFEKIELCQGSDLSGETKVKNVNNDLDSTIQTRGTTTEIVSTPFLNAVTGEVDGGEAKNIYSDATTCSFIENQLSSFHDTNELLAAWTDVSKLSPQDDNVPELLPLGTIKLSEKTGSEGGKEKSDINGYQRDELNSIDEDGVNSNTLDLISEIVQEKATKKIEKSKLEADEKEDECYVCNERVAVSIDQQQDVDHNKSHGQETEKRIKQRTADDSSEFDSDSHVNTQTIPTVLKGELEEQYVFSANVKHECLLVDKNDIVCASSGDDNFGLSENSKILESSHSSERARFLPFHSNSIGTKRCDPGTTDNGIPTEDFITDTDSLVQNSQSNYKDESFENHLFDSAKKLFTGSNELTDDKDDEGYQSKESKDKVDDTDKYCYPRKEYPNLVNSGTYLKSRSDSSDETKVVWSCSSDKDQTNSNPISDVNSHGCVDVDGPVVSHERFHPSLTQPVKKEATEVDKDDYTGSDKAVVNLKSGLKERLQITKTITLPKLNFKLKIPKPNLFKMKLFDNSNSSGAGHSDNDTAKIESNTKVNGDIGSSVDAFPNSTNSHSRNIHIAEHPSSADISNSSESSYDSAVNKLIPGVTGSNTVNTTQSQSEYIGPKAKTPGLVMSALWQGRPNQMDTNDSGGGGFVLDIRGKQTLETWTHLTTTTTSSSTFDKNGNKIVLDGGNNDDNRNNSFLKTFTECNDGYTGKKKARANIKLDEAEVVHLNNFLASSEDVCGEITIVKSDDESSLPSRSNSNSSSEDVTMTEGNDLAVDNRASGLSPFDFDADDVYFRGHERRNNDDEKQGNEMRHTHTSSLSRNENCELSSVSRDPSSFIDSPTLVRKGVYELKTFSVLVSEQKELFLSDCGYENRKDCRDEGVCYNTKSESYHFHDGPGEHEENEEEKERSNRGKRGSDAMKEVCGMEFIGGESDETKICEVSEDIEDGVTEKEKYETGAVSVSGYTELDIIENMNSNHLNGVGEDEESMSLGKISSLQGSRTCDVLDADTRSFEFDASEDTVTVCSEEALGKVPVIDVMVAERVGMGVEASCMLRDVDGQVGENVRDRVNSENSEDVCDNTVGSVVSGIRGDVADVGCGDFDRSHGDCSDVINDCGVNGDDEITNDEWIEQDVRQYSLVVCAGEGNGFGGHIGIDDHVTEDNRVCLVVCGKDHGNGDSHRVCDRVRDLEETVPVAMNHEKKEFVMIANVRRDDDVEGENGYRGEVDEGDADTIDDNDGELQNGELQNGELQNGELQNGELQNGELQNGELQNGELQNGELQNGELQNGELQNGELQNGELQNGELQNGELQNGELQNGELNETIRMEEQDNKERVEDKQLSRDESDRDESDRDESDRDEPEIETTNETAGIDGGNGITTEKQTNANGANNSCIKNDEEEDCEFFLVQSDLPPSSQISRMENKYRSRIGLDRVGLDCTESLTVHQDEEWTESGYYKKAEEYVGDLDDEDDDIDCNDDDDDDGDDGDDGDDENETDNNQYEIEDIGGNCDNDDDDDDVCDDDEYDYIDDVGGDEEELGEDFEDLEGMEEADAWEAVVERIFDVRRTSVLSEMVLYSIEEEETDFEFCDDNKNDDRDDCIDNEDGSVFTDASRDDSRYEIVSGDKFHERINNNNARSNFYLVGEDDDGIGSNNCKKMVTWSDDVTDRKCGIRFRLDGANADIPLGVESGTCENQVIRRVKNRHLVSDWSNDDGAESTSQIEGSRKRRSWSLERDDDRKRRSWSSERIDDERKRRSWSLDSYEDRKRRSLSIEQDSLDEFEEIEEKVIDGGAKIDFDFDFNFDFCGDSSERDDCNKTETPSAPHPDSVDDIPSPSKSLPRSSLPILPLLDIPSPITPLSSSNPSSPSPSPSPSPSSSTPNSPPQNNAQPGVGSSSEHSTTSTPPESPPSATSSSPRQREQSEQSQTSSSEETNGRNNPVETDEKSLSSGSALSLSTSSSSNSSPQSSTVSTQYQQNLTPEERDEEVKEELEETLVVDYNDQPQQPLPQVATASPDRDNFQNNNGEPKKKVRRGLQTVLENFDEKEELIEDEDADNHNSSSNNNDSHLSSSENLSDSSSFEGRLHNGDRSPHSPISPSEFMSFSFSEGFARRAESGTYSSAESSTQMDGSSSNVILNGGSTSSSNFERSSVSTINQMMKTSSSREDSTDMAADGEQEVDVFLESPNSGLHRIYSENVFQQNSVENTKTEDPYKKLERSQSDASLLRKDVEKLVEEKEVHLTAAENSSTQNISECNRVYLDLSKAEVFEKVELGESGCTMMRTSSGRLLETIPQDEELKTGDLSYIYASHRSFSTESSSSMEDLNSYGKAKTKDLNSGGGTKYKNVGKNISDGGNSNLASKSNLRSSFQIYSHSLKQKVRQLQMGSLPEQVNALKELNVLMEQAWSMPVYGKDLAYELCDILRTESALDIIVGNVASNNRELMKVSARLLEQSLTTYNRRQVADTGLEMVVKMTHDCIGDCELAQTCTGILESLFKTSEETCSRVIRLGGLDVITYWCRCNDRVTLKNCAIALSNLALYGGSENQQEMTKHKVPEWLFPLAFVEDDSVRYYALLAIGVLVSNKEIENAVISSGTLDLVLPFVDCHDPAEFAQRDMSHRHGRSPGWLKRLIPVLSSKREEAQSLAAFHFVMEAGIKSEQDRKEVLYKIGAVDPLKWLASTPNRVASRLAGQALRIIGEEIPHKLSQQVPLWTTDDVVHWIAQVGFSAYTDVFQACQVDGDLLLQLSEDDLKVSMDMPCSVTRKRFQRELRDLKMSTDYTSCDPSMLGSWLRNVSEDMAQYTYQMLHAGLDRPLLSSVTNQHLMQDCGVINGIHRMKILAKIDELKSTPVSPTISTEEKPDVALKPRRSPKAPIDVFISYRRSNGSQLASLLKVHLQLRGFTVFIDIERLRAGKFDENLLQSVKTAKNFIIVLTQNSLDRCMGDDVKKDWVHREIVAAMEAGINIIPLMDNFRWPAPDSIPEDMRNLAYFNGIRWIHDYQDACVDKLESFLRGESSCHREPTPVNSDFGYTSITPVNSSSHDDSTPRDETVTAANAPASFGAPFQPATNTSCKGNFQSDNSPPYQRAQGLHKEHSVDIDSPPDS